MRQQFAMAAMQAIYSANIGFRSDNNGTCDVNISQISELAISQADELIKALNETPNPNEN